MEDYEVSCCCDKLAVSKVLLASNKNKKKRCVCVCGVQKLVAIAAEEEEKKQKTEQRIARALDKKFPKASQAPSEV
jgi:hypothetical protein